MDINQMHYFVSIVQSNFNMSDAAKKIHISQPSLSRFVTRFEAAEGIDLFNRSGGRLISLTNAGELIYSRSLSILSAHNLMLNDLRELSQFHLGTISIGIPPIILSILMTKPLSALTVANPNLKISLSEISSFDIQDALYAEQLDLGILMSPNDMNQTLFNENILFNEDLVVYVNKNHPLAARKDPINWKELDKEKVAILDDNFMINRLLVAKFNQYKIHPRIFHKVGSWDFLLETAKNSDLITILPKTIHRIGKVDNLVVIPIEDPVEWKIALLYRKKTTYTRLENYMIHTLTYYFKQKEDLHSIEQLNETKTYNLH